MCWIAAAPPPLPPLLLLPPLLPQELSDESTRREARYNELKLKKMDAASYEEQLQQVTMGGGQLLLPLLPSPAASAIPQHGV